MKKLIASITLPVLIAGCGEANLPDCDSQESQNLIGQIINDMPLVKASGASFVAIKQISEQGFNDAAQLRACSAVLVTTAGENELQYSIKWQDREKATFYVEAQIVY